MREWKEDEDVFLWDSYGKLKTKDIAEKLGRSVNGVQNRIYRLNRRNKDKRLIHKDWNGKEDTYIIQNFRSMDIEKLEKKLGRSRTKIRQRAKELGLTRKIHKWTDEEYEFIRNHWNMMGTDRMAQTLGVKEITLIRRASRVLGLTSMSETSDVWYTVPTLVEMLGVTKHHIYYYIEKGILKARKFKFGNTIRYRVNEATLKTFLIKNMKYYDTSKGNSKYITSLFTDVRLLSDNGMEVADIPEWLHEKIEYDKINKNFKVSRKEWTRSEMDGVFRLAEEGYVASKIGDKFGRSKNSISSMVCKMKREGL